jgi:hypothetical protein
LQKVPGLTQQNIDDLRDTISGVVNQGRQAVTEDSTTQQISLLQQDKAALEAENSSLKATITQITQLGSAIQPLVADNSSSAQA